MSYNVSHSEYLSGKLFITKGVVRKYLATRRDDLPEGNFLSYLNTGDDVCDPLPIEHLQWRGEWSGHGYETVLLEILRETTGEAAILFTWEGGDGLTGLHVKDGVVTKKQPKMILEDLPV